MLVRIVAATAAVVIGAVLAVVAIGYALPQGHVASREASFAIPPAALFDTIANVGKYPEWRSDVSRVEILSTDPLAWRETSNGDIITFQVVESRRPEHLRVRIADPDLPFGGSWTYQLQPDGPGTRLTVTEQGEVYNPVFRFVSRFIFGHTATIDSFLAALRARTASVPH